MDEAHGDDANMGIVRQRQSFRALGDVDVIFEQIAVGINVIAAVLLVFALGIGFLAWQDQKGNTGPPLPLSGGIFGVALSPDGRTIVTISANLEMWDVADRAHSRRLAYTPGDIAIGADPTRTIPTAATAARVRVRYGRVTFCHQGAPSADAAATASSSGRSSAGSEAPDGTRSTAR